MQRSPDSTIRIPSTTAMLTVAAMLAFAANSLLSRLALGEQSIDAASFASLRIVSGALTLVLIALPRWRTYNRSRADWRSVVALFTYTVFFSFAYLSLDTGTGALILFGAVQLTMILYALRNGEYYSYVSWAGLALAVVGLVFLVSPGISAPDPLGALLMSVAGIAWGAYSLLGRSVSDPISATTANFIFAVPLVVASSLFLLSDIHITLRGALLATASGSLASGVGYIAWYSALRGLTASRAATVQLSVPVIAAFGGVSLLSEPITLRLVAASAATLGGVAIVLSQHSAQKGQD